MSPLPRLFFAHANGYTPDAYQPLLQGMHTSHRVEAPALLPLRNGAAPSGRWDDIANDLAQLLDAGREPAVGVGHSLGAVALMMAAAQRPSRFSRLVLIEPPAIPAWAAALLRHGPAAIRRKSPMAAAARRHTESWGSFEQAYAHERARRLYTRVPDQALTHLLRSSLQQDGGTWRLRFRKEWEARLYETPTSVWPLLARPLPPITVLRGADSRVLRAGDLRRWRHMRPDDRVIEIAHTGHLLPFEQPQQVGALLHP